MEKIILYAPNIAHDANLPHDEALHCIKVLRMKEGDKLLIADGKGLFYEAQITDAHQKHCRVAITKELPAPKTWSFNLHIAFAPTKNMDRIEWFAEKATEIGIDQFTPLLCHYSERKELKSSRIEKILVSAMKQSQKAILPKLVEMTTFELFIKQPFDGQKFIAHCYDMPKQALKKLAQKEANTLILIGPEGDFSEHEVELAIAHGFEPVSLGDSRLRTETAALTACFTMHVIN